ncbi:hypothetical protein Lal_00042976 [Lupinus albus]|nr:hypothetical protein Lal_00042976 [Lupinus albus]
MHKQLALGETVKSRDILAVGNLNLEDHLLHYFLIYVIIPNFSNHSQINDIELQLMYALKHNLEINWAWTVMKHMWSVRETHSQLPYAIIISNILAHFGVSTNGESKITLNTHDSKIDVDSGDFRLSEKCVAWVSEILAYTEGFSPERELSHLSESRLA